MGVLMDQFIKFYKNMKYDINIYFWITVSLTIISFICLFLILYGIKNNYDCYNNSCPNKTEAYYTLDNECYCVIPNENNKKK